MRCVLGIGNPGDDYADTRHNCGFLVLDELARRHRLDAWRSRWGGLVCEWQWRIPARAEEEPGQTVKALLVKPQGFVNRSGECAQAVMTFHKIAPRDLLVVVDDLNLSLGDLRLRGEGSSGGHNGLKDIEARIGPAYPRLRLGIGPPPSAQQIGHVLGSFTAQERPDVEAMIAKAADCVESWLRDGIAVSCRFNGPLRPPPARVKPPPITAPPVDPKVEGP